MPWLELRERVAARGPAVGEALGRGLSWAAIAALPLLVTTEVIGGIGVIVAVEGLSVSVVALGQDRLGMARTARQGENDLHSEGVRIVVMFTLALSPVMILAVNGLTQDAGEDGGVLGLLTAVAVGLTAIFRIRLGELRGSSENLRFLTSRSSQAAARLAVLWMLLSVINPEDPYTGQRSYLIASILAATAGILLAGRHGSGSRRARLARGQRFRTAAVLGWPLLIHGLAATGMVLADRIFLGVLGTYTEVGMYTVAYSIAAAIGFGYGLIAVAEEPSVIRSVAACEGVSPVAAYERKLLTSYAVTALAGGAIVPFIGSRVDFELAVLAGLFCVLAAAHAVWAPYLAANAVLVASDRTDLLARGTTAAFATNCLLNVLLIPLLGVLGAALATLGSYYMLSALARRAAASISGLHLASRLATGTAVAGLAMGVGGAVLVLVGQGA